MIAPFATLIFLATLWLIAKVVVETLDESGGRIVAALFAPFRADRNALGDDPGAGQTPAGGAATRDAGADAVARRRLTRA